MSSIQFQLATCVCSLFELFTDGKAVFRRPSRVSHIVVVDKSRIGPIVLVGDILAPDSESPIGVGFDPRREIEEDTAVDLILGFVKRRQV